MSYSLSFLFLAGICSASSGFGPLFSIMSIPPFSIFFLLSIADSGAATLATGPTALFLTIVPSAFLTSSSFLTIVFPSASFLRPPTSGSPASFPSYHGPSSGNICTLFLESAPVLIPAIPPPLAPYP